MEPIYSINDIIQHKKLPEFKRKIIFIYNDLFDNRKETYYQTIILDNIDYSPTHFTKDMIDNYYIKI